MPSRSPGGYWFAIETTTDAGTVDTLRGECPGADSQVRKTDRGEEPVGRVDPARRRVLNAIVAGAAVMSVPMVNAADVALRRPGVLPARSTVNLAKRGMQMLVTGSGSALPDPLRAGASCAIVIDGTVLQFDFGRCVMENLMLAGINPVKIDKVFFTHLHFDHINDYDYYAITTWIAGRQEIVDVYGPRGTQEMSDGAIKVMNKANYRFITEEQTWPAGAPGRPTRTPPFAVHEIGPGKVLETEKFKITCAEMVHLNNAWTTSLAYRVESDYGSIAISGDSSPTDNMVALAKDVDVLLHDCVIPDFGMTTDGRFSFKAYHDQKRVGHTSPTQLGMLAKRANVRMLVPYHLAPFGSVSAAIEMSKDYYGTRSDAAIWAEYIYAIKQSYAGPVVLAEDLQIFDFESVR